LKIIIFIDHYYAQKTYKQLTSPVAGCCKTFLLLEETPKIMQHLGFAIMMVWLMFFGVIYTVSGFLAGGSEKSSFCAKKFWL